jgi:transcriptional regulator with XRE-family HTH domain
MVVVMVDQQQSPRQRGERLRQARKLAGLTLREMSKGSLINFNTLGGWESGKHGGLTEKGAIKVVERLAHLNIKCTPEWLLYEKGEPPYMISMTTINQHSTSLPEILAYEINNFKQSHSTFLGMNILDDAMEPLYCYGDYVAGLPMSLEQLPKAVGKNIIVRLNEEQMLCRKLVMDSKNNKLALLSLNFSSKNLLLDAQIKEWALIMYHLRNESL